MGVRGWARLLAEALLCALERVPWPHGRVCSPRERGARTRLLLVVVDLNGEARAPSSCSVKAVGREAMPPVEAPQGLGLGSRDFRSRRKGCVLWSEFGLWEIPAAASPPVLQSSSVSPARMAWMPAPEKVDRRGGTTCWGIKQTLEPRPDSSAAWGSHWPACPGKVFALLCRGLVTLRLLQLRAIRAPRCPAGVGECQTD